MIVILISFVLISLHIYKNVTVIDFPLIIITIINIIIIIAIFTKSIMLTLKN